MQYEFKGLQKFITDQLCDAYYHRSKTTLTVHHLLTLVANKYDIYIRQPNSGKCDILGNGDGCGYNIIIDTIFLIEKMNKTGIIEYYKQGGGTVSYKFDDIIGDSSVGHDLQGSISGTAVEFILNHGGDSIWVSPDVENFGKYGFVSEGLFLTRQQANDAKTQVQEAMKQTIHAKRTLICSIIALFVSILTMFISIISMIASICVPFITNIISKCCH